MTCKHTNREAIHIHGGEGIVWCPNCGAYRLLTFKTTKQGGGTVVKGPWRLPKSSIEEILEIVNRKTKKA